MRSFNVVFSSVIALLFVAPLASAQAPTVTSSCPITAIVRDVVSNCDLGWRTYSQAVVVSYTEEVTSGTLTLSATGTAMSVSVSASVTESPQTIVLHGLPLDGFPVTVSASLSGPVSCTFAMDPLYTAPTNCDAVIQCSILACEALDQTACDPATNTYSQMVRVTYENPAGSVLIIHGQQFAVTGSPQIVELTGLPANGQFVDLTAYFQAEPDCRETDYRLFKAPEPCEGGLDCSVLGLEALDQSVCDPTTNTYTQDVRVTYENPRGETLVVHGQSFGVGESPQVVKLTGLVADGEFVDVVAYFTADPECRETEYGLFRAAETCSQEPACSILALASGEQSVCDPATNTYTQQVIVTYENPSGSVMIVNDQPFVVTGSPQTVSLTGLPSDGRLVDVTAHFESDPECRKREYGMFRAPGSCAIDDACRIQRVRPGTIRNCNDDTRTYSHSIIVTYENAPETGYLNVSAFGSVFATSVSVPIETSPQTVWLTGLPLDGGMISVRASFSANSSCALTEEDLIRAPLKCDPFECMITDIIDDNHTECDPETETFSHRVIVEYIYPPSRGYLVVNGQQFPIEGSPQTVTLEGLVADGFPVDIVARFSAETGCFLVVPGLFVAPYWCLTSCSIDDLEAGMQTRCYEETNTYSQYVTVHYTNPPQGGELVVNGRNFPFDPAKNSKEVLLKDLVADGKPVDVTAYFTADPSCKRTEPGLFTAPEPCHVVGPCSIDDLEIVGDPVCDDDSETFALVVLVSYTNAPQGGKLVVNGQESDFDRSAGSQAVTLTGLDPEGEVLEITAYFTADPECMRTESFVVPEDCEDEDECDIDLEVGAQTECDPELEVYTQEIIVHFSEAPTTGTLDVTAIGMGFVEFTVSIEMTPSTPSPQSIVFEDLPLDGLPVGVCATFSAEPECEECEAHLYVAPEDCEEPGLTHVFVLLGDEDVRVDSPDDSQGLIHSNNDMHFVAENGNRGNHTGDLTAVDDITISGRNVIEGSAAAGDDLRIDDRATVTGDKIDDADVDEIAIPSIPDFEPGELDVHVEERDTRRLDPGDYDEVSVDEDATLILRSGVYNIDEFTMDETSVLVVNINDELPITINVDSRLEFDDGVLMELSPPDLTTLVRFNYDDDDRSVKFGDGSVILGTIIAPEAGVELGEESFFKGAICAERIIVDEHATFGPHGSDLSVPKEPKMVGSPPTDTRVVAPRGYQLALHPNPFNPNTTISYSVPQAGAMSLTVYAANGRVVRTLVQEYKPVGTYDVVWNGRDHQGIEVPSGRYYAVLRSAGSIRKSLGMVLLR